jgi:hypothetical protein
MWYLATLYGNADPAYRGSVEHKTLIQGAPSWIAQYTAASSNPDVSLALGDSYNHRLAVPGHC